MRATELANYVMHHHPLALSASRPPMSVLDIDELSYDDSKAIYRVGRSVVDGVCPKCCGNTVDLFADHYVCVDSGCSLKLPKQVIDEALRQFDDHMKQTFSVFSEWAFKKYGESL